jgi:hypothetical protein
MQCWQAAARTRENQAQPLRRPHSTGHGAATAELLRHGRHSFILGAAHRKVDFLIYTGVSATGINRDVLLDNNPASTTTINFNT